MMPSQHFFTFPFYLPRVIRQIDNWPRYVANYALRRERPAEYRLRGGYRLVDEAGSMAGTIAVVFVRREYGLLENCRVIVDIGSNMGTFALYAALQCPAAKVHCFEPEPRNFATLQRNIALNSLQDRVLLYPCAVASSSGERDMAVTSSPLNTLVPVDNGANRVRVSCLCLSDILERLGVDRIDVLKVNCEGAEYEIFENLPQECFQRLPDIRLEYHNLDRSHRNGRALAKVLEDHGYRIRRFTRWKDESGFIWADRK